MIPEYDGNFSGIGGTFKSCYIPGCQVSWNREQKVLDYDQDLKG